MIEMIEQARDYQTKEELLERAARAVMRARLQVPDTLKSLCELTSVIGELRAAETFDWPSYKVRCKAQDVMARLLSADHKSYLMLSTVLNDLLDDLSLLYHNITEELYPYGKEPKHKSACEKQDHEPAD